MVHAGLVDRVGGRGGGGGVVAVPPPVVMPVVRRGQRRERDGGKGDGQSRGADGGAAAHALVPPGAHAPFPLCAALAPGRGLRDERGMELGVTVALHYYE